MFSRVSEIANTCFALNFIARRSMMSNLIGQTPVRYFSSLILGFFTIIHFVVLIVVFFIILVFYSRTSQI